MWIVNTKSGLREHLGAEAGPIVLVPTMGALHEGHTSLIDLARDTAGPGGTVVVSIFVNPIQFDRASDLEKYPRPLEADLELCRSHGVEGVFLPEEGEMYTADRSITVTEDLLARHLCGATRAGHFDGVCTVVLKLFNLTRCNAAVFGEKDFQQLAIIRRMVRDLDLDVGIIAHPTLREADGLAMSSRNARLSLEHRADAPRIRQSLLAASGGGSAQNIIKSARRGLEQSPWGKIDYLSLVDAVTLAPAADLRAPTVLACAVYYDDVRLIDHVSIEARPCLS